MLQEDQDLNTQMMELLQFQPQTISYIDRLKFKNTVYAPNNSISLLQDQGQQHCFGKIIHIAKVPNIQFPVLLVAWYFHRQDPLLKDQGFNHLSQKELVISELTDWQYVESLKAKITVLGEKQYGQLPPQEKKNSGLYFCRSSMKTVPVVQIVPLPARVCQCSSFFNPDDQLEICLFCGILFHSKCSGRADLCLACHF